jgi:NTP pyrophosphatase (non-canonical NTP hydrolase)
MNNCEKEILLITQEECAEVIQAVSKIFRFGYDSVYPEDGLEDNRKKLQNEVGDLLAMIDLMYEKQIINEIEVQQALSKKKSKLKVWSKIYTEEAEVLN